jgi:simple sugar transport system ATP-binding protein
LAGIRRARIRLGLLNGQPLSPEGATRGPARRHRPCARGPHHVGLVLDFTAWENAILGYHDAPRYLKGRCSTIDASAPTPRRRSSAFDIRPPNPDLKTANFSGGNQQKIVLAREIEQDPDRAAGRPADARRRHRRHRVHPQAIIEMRDAGKAVLLVSVELDEIRALSDRIW